MTLLDYMKGLDKPGVEEFAEKCGTTVGHLKQVAYENRRPNAALAIAIDRHTAGLVPCEQLRADIDWQ